MPNPIPDHEPWHAKVGSRLARSSAKRREKAKRSSTESLAFGVGHAVLITIVAATTGIGFYLALGIVVLVISVLRLAAHFHSRARGFSRRTPVDPFGR